MARSADEVWVTVNGERFLVRVEDITQNPVIAFVDGQRFEVSLDEDPADLTVREAQTRPEGVSRVVRAGVGNEIAAPMPGDIVEILVKPGQAVRVGDPLCVLDAMKMKNTIHASRSGRIAEVCVAAGQSVEYGTTLFRLGGS